MYQTLEQKIRARNEVIRWLMNYGLDHQFGVTFSYSAKNDDPSEAFPEYSTAVINANWKNIDEIPFIIGHELGHLLLGHSRKEFEESPAKRIRMEKEANEYSLDLLTEYCDLHEIYFYNKYSFASAFGIPKDCYYLLEEQA
ncbi:MAG: ImmA/IrrE family metallo-endopeptidase [Candidatus Lactobacillus pullistercoris]|uniref:ImmA/IrrE family metallo-endopeptidase n=1 Tax=Candidatus Lactobacillus pullistercoris TaxID=2838636 RepID=A0A9E2NVX9_9LACO|nr:ImmA/IrrE family metallo-endopeptidase [Candidatus Lactobacillus pullistercoris]